MLRVAFSVANCGTTRYLASFPVTQAQRLSSDPRNVRASNGARAMMLPAASAGAHDATTGGAGPDESEHPATSAAAGTRKRKSDGRMQTSIREEGAHSESGALR
jgi:hypothetical protein